MHCVHGRYVGEFLYCVLKKIRFPRSHILEEMERDKEQGIGSM